MKVKLGFVSLCLVLLSGCGLKKFDCPYTDGVTCKSLSEVNERINQGLSGTRKHLPKNKPKKENFFAQKTLNLNETVSSLVHPKTPLRLPEQVLRIWLAPYETIDGLFHSEGFIYVVVRQSSWVESNSK